MEKNSEFETVSISEYQRRINEEREAAREIVASRALSKSTEELISELNYLPAMVRADAIAGQELISPGEVIEFIDTESKLVIATAALAEIASIKKIESDSAAHFFFAMSKMRKIAQTALKNIGVAE